MKIPKLCNENGVKLVVIDSIAALLRMEFDVGHRDQMRQRTQVMFTLASKLK